MGSLSILQINPYVKGFRTIEKLLIWGRPCQNSPWDCWYGVHTPIALLTGLRGFGTTMWHVFVKELVQLTTLTHDTPLLRTE